MIEPATAVLNDAALDWLDLIGRTKPGADTKSMEAQMQVELRQFLLSPESKVEERSKPLVAKQTLHFSPGGGGVQRMRDEYQDGLHLLMWISAFVLLIACANLANLMLVRATTRKQQISVRAALGATRGTLISQALTESVVLAMMGGVAGIAMAFAGTSMILRLAFGNDYVPIHATPSLPVLAFAFAISFLTGILFGIAPCMDDGECKSRGSFARRGPLHGTQRHVGTEIAGGGAGSAFTGVALCSGPAHAQLE